MLLTSTENIMQREIFQGGLKHQLNMESIMLYSVLTNLDYSKLQELNIFNYAAWNPLSTISLEDQPCRREKESIIP